MVNRLVSMRSRMMSKSLRFLVLGASAVVQLAMPVGTAQAGPFLDWLLGRPIYTYPAPVAVAPVAVAPVPAYLPAASTALPVTASYATVAPSGFQVNQPTTLGYAPAATISSPVTTHYP